MKRNKIYDKSYSPTMNFMLEKNVYRSSYIFLGSHNHSVLVNINKETYFVASFFEHTFPRKKKKKISKRE